MEQIFGSIPDALHIFCHNSELDQALVFAAWRRCAGGPLSERTAPIEFLKDRLIIAVENAVWRQHLEDLSPPMIARINAEVGHGTLKFIEFRVDSQILNAQRDDEGDTSPDHALDVPPLIAKAAETISDPDLRSSFLQAASHYLGRQNK
jgi:hypothetical protein